MNESTTEWSRDEFRAYILLYSAHADFIETDEERDMIKSKIDNTLFERIHAEFDVDSDFQRIQKIMSSAKRLDYSQEQVDTLMTEIKALFLSDGKYDILEKNMLRELKRLLHQ